MARALVIKVKSEGERSGGEWGGSQDMFMYMYIERARARERERERETKGEREGHSLRDVRGKEVTWRKGGRLVV
jgi:hypothetical protein